MTNTTGLAGILRSLRPGGLVLLACLTLAMLPTFVFAEVFDPVNLYYMYEDPAGSGHYVYDAGDYVRVVLTYGPENGGFRYTYEVTNYSTRQATLSQFYFYSPEVTNVDAFGGFVHTAGWGHYGPQGFDYTAPAVYTHQGGVQLWWRTLSAGPAYGHHAEFGFTTTYDVSHVARDIGSAYVAVAYSNAVNLLYGPDPHSSPGGQVPEWSSIMLSLIGFGGMSWRFRQLRYT